MVRHGDQALGAQVAVPPRLAVAIMTGGALGVLAGIIWFVLADSH